jgi:hypothetical protein
MDGVSSSRQDWPYILPETYLQGSKLSFLTISGISQTLVTIYQQHILPSMADLKIFSTCLTCLGSDTPTQELLDKHGICTIHDLIDLPFCEIDKIIHHLSFWKSKAEVDDDDDPVPVPTFPYLAVRKFKALRAWDDNCILRDLPLNTQLTFGSVLPRISFTG